jgi:glycosidase
MDQKKPTSRPYFAFEFPMSGQSWHRFGVRGLLPPDLESGLAEPTFTIRQLADAINREPRRSAEGSPPLPAEMLLALRTLNQALRHVARQYFTRDNPGGLERGRRWSEESLGADRTSQLHRAFLELYPPLAVQTGRLTGEQFLETHEDLLVGLDQTTLEMLLLFLNTANPAARPAREVFDDGELRHRASYVPFITGLEEFLEQHEPPSSEGESIFHLLRSPMLASPDSLSGQIEHIRQHWRHLLPRELLDRLQLALDVLKEADTFRLPQYGPPPVLEFGPGTYGYDEAYPEPEAFSRDADWMSNVVLMAKSVHVWLDQLSRWYGRGIHTLADIPDEELDKLARWGVTGLWLIGLWERSQASRLIKQYMGNPEAAASAYALHEYRISDDLGGQGAYENLRDRARRRGIRLASDMVPNHMGIDSRWVVEHPEWFLQSDHPPFPAYKFTGGDLCDDPGVSIRIEDGYWNHSDAAVVFQRVDNSTGQARYIYHGNDGTSMPWNDTAQLNFLVPEVREAVIQVILQVARMFPIIRFDAAMTLAKKHYQRLWFPAPGDAGSIPSRAEHGMSKPRFDEIFPVEFWREVVDRVGREVPDTLLLAEAFWLMEGYFVRTLGMHRVYNSAFMNMLKMEDNQKYRQTIKNVLEFSPAVLQRFVNFMNNPDEKTAVEQFGRGDKYFGCALLLITMPGLPMLGHGQIEGFSEKYGMEYRRAMWDEQVDGEMVRRHEREIFPLIRLRRIFSGAENFALFDFQADGGWVDENVFAYSNRLGQERGLIIFNNSYESTSGRIRTSSAVNTGSAEQPHLVQRSLTEALGLPADHDHWCLFRDHIDGLEYIRSCAELARDGLHTHLRGYQHRALINFRVVTDPDGAWARLAGHLQGGGAADLARARRGLEIAPAVTSLRRWTSSEVLAWLETLWEAEDRAEAMTGQAEATSGEEEDVPAAGHPEPELPPGTDDLVAGLRRMPELYQDRRLGPKLKLEWEELLDRIPGSRILQAVYLARGLTMLPGPWQPGATLEISGCLLQEKDADLLLEAVVQDLQAWTGHEYAGWSTGALAWLLARHRPAGQAMAEGQVHWLAPLLDDPQMKQFLGVNEHQGILWLTREPLLTLLDAMVVGQLASSAPDNPTGMLDARALILSFAEKASYQMGRFKDYLEDFSI